MANKNLFTKFASLAMAGALAFSAVPVAGLNGAFNAEARNSESGFFTAVANKDYKYVYNPVAKVSMNQLVRTTTGDNATWTPDANNSGSNFKYQIFTEAGKLVHMNSGGDFTTLTPVDLGNAVFPLTTAGNYYVEVTSGDDPALTTSTDIGSKVKFTVEKRNISDAVVTLSEDDVTYDGKHHASAVKEDPVNPTVVFPAGTMAWDASFGVLGTDSDLHYDRSGGTDAGTYKGTLEAVGDNFTGKKSDIEFTINKFQFDRNKMYTDPDKAENTFTKGEIRVTAYPAAYAGGSNVETTVKVEACLENGKLETLTKGTDYSVKCTGTNKGTGSGTARIDGTGKNFNGTVTVPYNIVEATKNLSAATIELKNGTKAVNDGDSITYDGTQINADASTVKVPDENGKLQPLTINSDYRIEFEYNDDEHPADAGVVYIKFVGVGEYTGTAIRTLTIAPKNIDEITFTQQGVTPTYDGTAQKPDFTNVNLTPDQDYVIEYSNNINAGKAMANIVGLGNYTGVQGKEFDIDSRDMSAVTLESIPNQIYSGSAVEPALSLKYKNNDGKEFTLEEGVDYTAKYDSNTSAGRGRVEITGAGNYDGTKQSDFEIKDAAYDLANAEVTLAEDSVAYDGKYHSASVKAVKMADATGTLKPLTNGKDFTVKNVSVKEVGTYDIVIEAKGDTYGGSITVPFAITGYDVADAGFSLKKSSVKYNGKNQKPELVVAEGTRYDGKDMVEGTDYEVSGIKNIKNVGKLTVKVTGLGAYAGTEKSLTFKVTKADQPMKVSTKTASVKASKVAKKNQTIKASKVFSVSKNQGTVSYKKTSGNSKIKVASNGKITVKKGLKKGTYKIKVKVTAKGNSNYNSGNKTVKATIKVK